MVIKIDENWKLENGRYQCPFCNKNYTRNGIATHIFRSHTKKGKDHNPNIGYEDGGRIVWNKGLTKDNDERVKKTGETFSMRNSQGLFNLKGRKLHKETKLKISNSMKKAHKEKRAWNIGMSRWNNEPSYPEKFFMKVIENEFVDKNYKREYPVSIYSIDFAWVDKKLAIEIDGAQHEKPEYKERDKRKDRCLKENGWEILRIKWDDMCNDTKVCIEKAKNFIEKK